MNRIKNGTLKQLSEITGIKVSYLSDLAATRRRPSWMKARELEKAAAEIGLEVLATTWIEGSEAEIKQALSRG